MKAWGNILDKRYKKDFLATQALEDFISEQPEEVQIQFGRMVEILRTDGYLLPPYGKKMSGYKNLFELRITHGRNVRVFYCYMDEDLIAGLSGFVKKTQKTPEHEIKKALKLMRNIEEGSQ